MAIPSWITISQNSGNSGVTTVTITASTNTELSQRTGQLTVNGVASLLSATVSVSQSGETPPYERQYLTFKIKSAGNIAWYNSGTSGKVIEYSKDNGTTWTSITASSATTIPVNTGETVLFKGLNDTYSGSYFSGTTCQFDVEGNIMSLLYRDDFEDKTTLVSASTFFGLFERCTGLTSAENLILPATTLASRCYQIMFEGCSSLVSVPKLPATTLTECCYNNMFKGCTSLVSVPNNLLPAINLEPQSITAIFPSCYGGMFDGCTSLVTAPELPATTLMKSCYEFMFRDCTSLTTAPTLPATTLTQQCYQYMFDGCTSLVNAPVLPATTLAPLCYNQMFKGCTSLVNAPVLPATTLADSCYNGMFSNCTSLTAVPSGLLPATTLASDCYTEMFYHCDSLTTAPDLPSTTLVEGCYYGMFDGCTSLVNAPVLPATTLVNYCYERMFSGCTSLNYIKCLATNISATGCTSSWVYDVASAGTFVKDASMNDWLIDNVNGVPIGWTLINDYYISVVPSSLSVPNSGGSYTLTITSNGAWSAVTPSWITLSSSYGTGNTTITATVANNPSSASRTDNITFNTVNNTATVSVSQSGVMPESQYFSFTALDSDYYNFSIGNGGSYSIKNEYYSIDNGATWISASGDNKTYLNAGDTVYLKATKNGGTSYTNHYTFSAWYGGSSLSKQVRYTIQGNILSLVYGDNFLNQTEFPEDSEYIFYNFNSSSNLLSTENLILPVTALTQSCYEGMFAGCSSLTTAPATLPATTLADSCYYRMFSACTSLVNAPVLPATTLASRCYQGMFQDCTSLTTAPELPAITLAPLCYNQMFKGCTSLVNAPVLPATTLADSCYKRMFSGCTSLTSIPSGLLPVTTLADSCYNGMFSNCTSLTAVPSGLLPATTLAPYCYQAMFMNCYSLTSIPSGLLPVTTLADSCYAFMFSNCTSLTTIPSGLLPATTLADSCYNGMFQGCSGLTAVPSGLLPATTLASGCYERMFYHCDSLTTAPDLPSTTLVEGCYYGMFWNCTNLNYIKCLATNFTYDWRACTYKWVQSVSSTGTFVKKSGVTWETGINGIPEGWTVQEV